jgi:hypothetical protein
MDNSEVRNFRSEYRSLVDSRDVTDLRAWERWIAHAGYLLEGLLPFRRPRREALVARTASVS